ncbi:MAG: hypothetical protein ACREFC_01085, partial [Stellaceae bacterium]
VIEGLPIFTAAEFGVPPSLTKKYEAKRTVYTVALVQLALARLKDDPGVSEITSEFGELISATFDADLVKQQKAAMTELLNGPLAHRTIPHFSWALGWFREIGFEISDFGALSRFLLGWPDAYATIHGGIRKLVSYAYPDLEPSE